MYGVEAVEFKTRTVVGCNTIEIRIPSRLEYQLIHGAALLYIVKEQQAPG